MWLTANELQQAFTSGTSERIVDALAALDASIEGMEALTVPAPPPSVLNVFSAELPTEVAETYLRVISQGNYFSPALQKSDQAAYLLVAAAQHAQSSYPLEASLLVKGSAEPLATLQATLEAFGKAQEAPSAGRVLIEFCSFLWSGTPAIRALTTQALRCWDAPAGLRTALSQALRDAPT
jgi:hypothetical protein